MPDLKNKKVLLVNGSPHEKGCTYTALKTAAAALESCGLSAETVWTGKGPVSDCTACGACGKTGRCVFSDGKVNDIIEAAEKADGFIFGSPVYYAHPDGRLISVMNRVFRAGGVYLSYKPAAAVTSARRAGTTAALDVINKYFAINSMPVVSSKYWNMVHGNTPEEVLRDKEGIQTMQLLGANMAWLIKCIAAAGAAGIVPPAQPEKPEKTNFIR